MKQPSLNQIRSAHAVVECNFSVSRAAHILHTTQPSVSKMLKALEDDLGTSVFIRSGGRIIGLSEFGNEILGYVRCILHYSAAVLERAQERKKEPKETVALVPVPRQQTVFGADPTTLFGKAAVFVVEIRSSVKACRFNSVAIEVEDYG